MKQKKEEIKNKILKAAEKKFLIKGFSNTTTRELAKTAQVTYGNMYKYFKNKEKILEAVIGIYAKNVQKGFNEFINHSPQIEFSNNLALGISRGLISLYEQSRKKFLIFFASMEGSKLNNIKIEIIKLLKKHMIKFIHDPVLADILTENLLLTIVRLAKEYKTIDNFKKAVNLYIQYHISGVKSIQ